jgi:transposase
MPAKKPAKKRESWVLSEADKDRIVELKLDCVSHEAVAAEVGCSKNTVTEYWHRYLDGVSEERRDYLERKQSEVIVRLQSVATWARQQAVSAATSSGMEEEDQHRAVARYLTEERQAWRQLSQVAGWDAPVRVAAQVEFETMGEDEAAAILAAYHAQQGT